MRLGQIAVGILSFSRDKVKKYEFQVLYGCHDLGVNSENRFKSYQPQFLNRKGE